MSLKETQKRGNRTIVAIFVIGVAVYLGFTPLFEQVPDGVGKQVVGSSFGAIFVIILTMYLLNKQTEIEQESKRSEKVFEEKVKVYKSMLNLTKDILSDGKLSSLETNQISFSMIELQMIGADETIQAFNKIFDNINDAFQSNDDDPVVLSDDQKLTLFKSISKFAQKCRVDLGIDEVELSDEIFNATVEEISLAVRGKKDYSKYKFEGNEYGKGRLVHAVLSHYVSNNPSISLNEMLKIFTPGKDGIASHKWGVFQTKDFGFKVLEDTGHKRFYLNEDDVLRLSDEEIVVCNQWGSNNIPKFLNLCKDLNINVD
jgi:hypothetical protein